MLLAAFRQWGSHQRFYVLPMDCRNRLIRIDWLAVRFEDRLGGSDLAGAGGRLRGLWAVVGSQGEEQWLG